LDDGGKREATITELKEEKAELEPKCDRLGRAIGDSDQESETLVKLLGEAEDRLARVNATLKVLKENKERHVPPTRTEIDQRRAELITAIEPMNRCESRDALRATVGTIRSVPYRQFDSKKGAYGDKVVLRAEGTLYLSALLPIRTQDALTQLCGGPIHELFKTVPIRVDLFEPSTGPRYGLQAYELSKSKTPTQVGRQLGITKRCADIATAYGKAMHEAGITDPYQELTEAPQTASRWGKRKPRTPPAA